MNLDDCENTSRVQEDWQTTKLFIRERIKFMFNNELFSDVKFQVRDGNGQSETTLVIPAHKFVLSIGSPVFGAMFYSELAETSDSIELPDCEYGSLLELFRYMYSDEVKLNGDNVMGVLYLAKKYIVPSLAKKCANYLQDNLDASNVFSILPMVNIYDEKDLVDQCWELIEEQTEAVVNSDGFVTVERPLLEALVERDNLRIEEVALFQAVDFWATKQCEKQCLAANGESKRKLLGEQIIKAIRFPVMTRQEFTTNVLDKNILTSDEMERLLLFFMSRLTSQVGFPEAMRLGSVSWCRRFEYLSGCWWPCDGLKDFLCFTVDRDITLHALRMCGSEGNDYTVTVDLRERMERRRYTLLASQTGTFSSRRLKYGLNNRYCYDVPFKPGVNLQKDTTYLIEASVIGPPSCMGKKGIRLIRSCGVTFTFSSVFRRNHNGTNVQRGQFPEFLFTVCFPF